MKTNALGSWFRGLHWHVKSFTPLAFEICSCRNIYNGPSGQMLINTIFNDECTFKIQFPE
jgi:hypothetical protein